MRKFDIDNGSIIWAFKTKVPVYAGKAGGQEYEPFTDNIDGGINFLRESTEPSSLKTLNMYLGDATASSNRATVLTKRFGKVIGNYAGKYVERPDDTWYKISVDLIATYGGGSEVSMTGYGWVKESDITNVESELDESSKNGSVNVSALELAARKAEDARLAAANEIDKLKLIKEQSDTVANKNEPSTNNKQALIDSGSSTVVSKTNWLLIGGIFVGVVAIGGSLLYAFRTPKTP